MNTIEIKNLTCRFGKTEAVRELTLDVPSGSIYAFLGTNGAGKTTTIKACMNLLSPSAGSARVLGVEAHRLGPKELARIGYVSENQRLPEQLTVKELIEYCRSLYPVWDDAFAGKLQEMLALPMDRKIKTFSRGMKIKAALLVSLAYHPELLVLDEPFSGLDPLMRDEMLQSILEISAQEHWTIFISSHDIDEIERLADWVGFIDNGRLSLSEPTESLRARFRRVDATLPEGIFTPGLLPPRGLLPKISGSSASWVQPDYTGDEAILAALPAGTVMNSTPLPLREIFVTLARANRPNP